MRILVLTLGTHGDVEPLRMLGQELLARGHEVMLATSSFLCTPGALPCVPIGDGSREQVLALIASLGSVGKPERDLAFVREWTIPQLNRAKEAINYQLATCDYLISNIPLSPRPQRGGRIVPGAFVSYEPPLDSPDELWTSSGGRVLPLVAANPALAANGAAYATGFWTWPSPASAPDAALRAFTADPRPLVVMTMGSMATFDPQALAACLLEVLERLDARAVVVAGWAGWQLPPGAEERLLLVPFADYDWLFAQAACVIHHGGSGTVGAVLRAGVPHILLPQIGSQQRYAEALTREQVCAGVLDTDALDTDALEQAVSRALHDPALRTAARNWQAQAVAERGLADAAGRIEAHWRQLNPPVRNEEAERLRPQLTPPTEADIAAFYQQHPPLFAGRCVYAMTQVQVSAPLERSAEIGAALVQAGTLPAWLDWLMERGIVYTTRQLVNASEDIPSDLLAALQQFKAGDVFSLQTAHGPAAIHLTGIEARPRSLHQSRADIAAFLENQRLGELIMQQRLRAG